MSTSESLRLLSMPLEGNILIVNRYKCDSDKYVLSCLRSGTCSFVENCFVKCKVNSDGAECTGSATDTSVENQAVGRPSAMHLSNDVVKYSCTQDDWILACPVNAACATIEYCLVKCIANERGAECSPGTSEKREIESEVDIEEKKTYQCAKDRTGVLVCQYGFCQTDHYCNRGWKCRDNCKCCKKSNMFAREINDVETTEVSSQSKDIPAAFPSVSSAPIVPTTTYGPCRRYQGGLSYCRESISMAFVCDPADYMWKPISKCAGRA
ncbi:hypothetical protein BKA58DRAFT_182583 [Alternaria rosae]|uniref:uncharacterized protein n=1 Tax=Alternaria rosae TaxID=1187941 RepID=UPI001E8DF139|nr:uncharacterized protein BKA58DRAFT_182583 [Alternaria rosae]KAH6870732.1 hypothetical protein BKA58DRAFT_182583 [Alternaria rosae]